FSADPWTGGNFSGRGLSCQFGRGRPPCPCAVVPAPHLPRYRRSLAPLNLLVEKPRSRRTCGPWSAYRQRDIASASGSRALCLNDHPSVPSVSFPVPTRRIWTPKGNANGSGPFFCPSLTVHIALSGGRRFRPFRQNSFAPDTTRSKRDDPPLIQRRVVDSFENPGLGAPPCGARFTRAAFTA